MFPFLSADALLLMLFLHHMGVLRRLSPMSATRMARGGYATINTIQCTYIVFKF